MQFMNNDSERVLQQDVQSAKNEDIKIYGKLVPASTEGVVASAVNIWDDNKAKSQQDINAELYKGESDIRDQYVKKSGDTMTGDLIGTTINAKNKIKTPTVEADNAKVSIIDTTRIKNDSGDNVQINKPFVFTTNDSDYSTTINTDGTIYMWDKDKNVNYLSIKTIDNYSSITHRYETLSYITSDTGVVINKVNSISNFAQKTIYENEYDSLNASSFTLRNGTESQLLAGNGTTANPIDETDINNLFK